MQNIATGATMNSFTLTDLARSKPMEPIVEREIQIRAYELYEEHGKRQGFALEDWLEAEAEVSARSQGRILYELLATRNRVCTSKLRQLG